MKTFKELPIGQEFRLARSPKEVWRKTAPTRTETAYYNATSLRRTSFMGHSAKVLLPPYEIPAKKPNLYDKFAAQVRAAGWASAAEYYHAVVDGKVRLPKKGE